MCDHESPAAAPTRPEVLEILVANHRAFLGFVERRVGSRDVAEEILQDAFVRNVGKLDTVRDSAIGWFYKVLRNAIIDHRRRRSVAERRLVSYAVDRLAQHEAEARDAELHDVACKCIGELASTLKPEYAEAIRRIELDGLSVKAYADEAGITSSNAGVRVFRAREALRKQVARACGTCAAHGCLDCSCARGGTQGCSHGS